MMSPAENFNDLTESMESLCSVYEDTSYLSTTDYENSEFESAVLIPASEVPSRDFKNTSCDASSLPTSVTRESTENSHLDMILPSSEMTSFVPSNESIYYGERAQAGNSGCQVCSSEAIAKGPRHKPSSKESQKINKSSGVKKSRSGESISRVQKKGSREHREAGGMSKMARPKSDRLRRNVAAMVYDLDNHLVHQTNPVLDSSIVQRRVVVPVSVGDLRDMLSHSSGMSSTALINIVVKEEQCKYQYVLAEDRSCDSVKSSIFDNKKTRNIE